MDGDDRTDGPAKLRFLRETAESLHRVAVNLPIELRREVLRVARRIDYDADELEGRLNPPP
jgi:hypothetical protein